jgi:hypothetical protein
LSCRSRRTDRPSAAFHRLPSRGKTRFFTRGCFSQNLTVC